MAALNLRSTASKALPSIPPTLNTVYIAAAHGRILSGSTVQSPAEVLVSHDRGVTWTNTGLAAKNLYIGANDSYRGTTGERLAVDPNDPGIVYFASRQNGLWRGVRTTGDQFDWQPVPTTLPAPSAAPGVTFVLFDKSGGANSSGETLNLYAGVYGSGVYASTDAGSTWAQIASTANPVRAAIASDGTLFVAFGGDEGATSGGVGRYRAGKWQDITPPSSNVAFAGISVDPANPQAVIAAANGNRKIYRSADQGQSWTAVAIAAPDAYTPQYYPPNPGMWGNAALVIDPANSKRVWQTNGYGVVETEDITAASNAWVWQMNNLEELVVQKVKVPPVVTIPGTSAPGADLLSVVADMVGLRHASRDVVPMATIDSFAYVAQGTGIAYCASQPQNAVFVGWDETDVTKPMSGITADNGLTWKHIPNTSPGTGGKIAMASDDPKKMVWAPYNATPVYSLDGGAAWNPAMTNGAPLPASWQLSNPWWNGDVLAADQIAPGTYYYFNNGDFYLSKDGGATWTNNSVAWPQDPHWVIGVSIVPNPVKAGDLWMAFAPNPNQASDLPAHPFHGRRQNLRARHHAAVCQLRGLRKRERREHALYLRSRPRDLAMRRMRSTSQRTPALPGPASAIRTVCNSARSTRSKATCAPRTLSTSARAAGESCSATEPRPASCGRAAVNP